jgi:hypothetical protein
MREKHVAMRAEGRRHGRKRRKVWGPLGMPSVASPPDLDLRRASARRKIAVVKICRQGCSAVL